MIVCNIDGGNSCLYSASDEISGVCRVDERGFPDTFPPQPTDRSRTNPIRIPASAAAADTLPNTNPECGTFPNLPGT